MNMKSKLFILVFPVLVLLFLAIPVKSVLAAKSPKPKITEIVGMNTDNVRVHFQINPVKAGQIIKVKYKLKTKKFNDVKYKIPKNAKRSGQVYAAASATGSAIDLHNLPKNLEKFIYEIKVKIAIPGKAWSKWSNTFSF
jgi:hypothetical protein